MAIESTADEQLTSATKKTAAPRTRRRKTAKRKKTRTSAKPESTDTGKAAAPSTSDTSVTQVDVADVAAAPTAETVTATAAETKKEPPRRKTRRGRTRRRPSAPAATEARDGQVQAEKVTGDGEAEHSAAKPEEDKPDTTAEAAPVNRGSRPMRGSVDSKPSTTSKRRPRKKTRRGTSDSGAPKPAPPSRPEQEPDKDEEPEEYAERDASDDSDIQPYTDRTVTPDSKRAPRGAGRREMIINVSAGYECRIAVLHENHLEELFIERDSTQSHVGNIYKGRITNVESSIQAAFIDFGLHKNGFLHISDVQPQYFPDHSGATEDVGRKIPRHHRPPIQKCFRRGQEVIVQITKEGVGTKGPTLTSYLSIPGRFLVMMPGMSRHGVSRKIEDEASRRKMRDLLNELTLPSDMGFILRTAGLDRSKRELQRDLNYLLRLWKTVVDRIKRLRAPASLYRESDLITRTIRDVYTTDFERVVVDDEAAARKAREFLRIAMPRTKATVELYSDREPIFHRLGIEAEIERINMRHVPLPLGGSLVIDSTEALVAIDVNSGRFRRPDDAEETALQINLEAAEEIARQLRLRDLGGLIVCDFIDMRHERNKRKVEQALREALKKHKERARTLKMSGFGLIEMTRQRQGPSIRRNLYSDCPHCHGAGQVKMAESVMLDAMRMIQLATHHDTVQKVTLSLSADVAFQLLNRKRAALHQIEIETGKSVVILGNPDFTSDQLECVCEDHRGREVAIGSRATTGH